MVFRKNIYGESMEKNNNLDALTSIWAEKYHSVGSFRGGCNVFRGLLLRGTTWGFGKLKADCSLVAHWFVYTFRKQITNSSNGSGSILGRIHARLVCCLWLNHTYSQGKVRAMQWDWGWAAFPASEIQLNFYLIIFGQLSEIHDGCNPLGMAPENAHKRQATVSNSVRF